MGIDQYNHSTVRKHARSTVKFSVSKLQQVHEWTIVNFLIFRSDNIKKLRHKFER